MAIDIGATAIDRGYFIPGGYTFIALDNPANASGIINTIEVWATNNIAGLIVGTFYLVSGTDFRCRDSKTIGNVTAGSKQTFAGLSLTVEAGDYIGCYYDTGSIDFDSGGYAGLYYFLGEAIDPDDQETYDLTAGGAISLYGTGVVVTAAVEEGYGYIIG